MPLPVVSDKLVVACNATTLCTTSLPTSVISAINSATNNAPPNNLTNQCYKTFNPLTKTFRRYGLAILVNRVLYVSNPWEIKVSVVRLAWTCFIKLVGSWKFRKVTYRGTSISAKIVYSVKYVQRNLKILIMLLSRVVISVCPVLRLNSKIKFVIFVRILVKELNGYNAQENSVKNGFIEDVTSIFSPETISHQKTKNYTFALSAEK